MTVIWPNPPLWLMTPTLPAARRGPPMAPVDVMAKRSTKLITPLQLGPMMRMPDARAKAISRAWRSRPSGVAVSANPAV